METLIKYANRKLYSTSLKRYMTLSELSANIKDGLDIEVIDHKTKTDITVDTLKQTILLSVLTKKQLIDLIKNN